MNVEEKANLLSDLLNGAELHFGQGQENAADEALWIVLHGCAIELTRFFEQPEAILERQIDLPQLEKIDQLVAQRIETKQPFAYLINEVWFDGRPFFIDDRAIIPRSYLVEWLPDGFAPWIDPEKVNSILDLCTGSGCLGITCGYYFTDARIVGSDIDEAALAVAQRNIELHGMQNRVRLNQGDCFANLEETFDLIICNPPYVSDQSMNVLPNEFCTEPDLAHRGGKDGLDFIIRMLVQASAYLNDHGSILIEAGSASNALEDRIPDFPFTWLSTEYDEMVVFILSKEELQQVMTML